MKAISTGVTAFHFSCPDIIVNEINIIVPSRPTGKLNVSINVLWGKDCVYVKGGISPLRIFPILPTAFLPFDTPL